MAVGDVRIPLQTEDELRHFMRRSFGIAIPDKVVTPGHTSPWRAFADAYFAKDPIAIWHASRGFGGKSYTLAALGLVEALTLKVDVKILGGSGEQSINVQKYISEEFFAYKNSPQFMWRGEPASRSSKFVWGNSITALTASTRSVRGPHPVRLRLDEIDEMNLTIFDAAMGQTMPLMDRLTKEILVPTQIVASSTHQYPDKTMSEVLQRAQAKGWPIYRWGYEETSTSAGGWLHPDTIEEKKEVVTLGMWDVEYDLGTPAPDSFAIDLNSVEKAFDRTLGEFLGKIGEYIEIEAPVQGASYSTGADWAKEKDFTTITTIRTDVVPYIVVAFERRQKEPWTRMAQRFDLRCERYKDSRLRRGGSRNAHDNTGLGDVMDDIIEARAKAVNMSGKVRQNLFMNYIVTMEKGEIIYPFIEWVYNEHKNCSAGMLYGSGHPPDSIVSGSMAIYAAKPVGSGRGG